MIKRVYFIRHGQSEANEKNVLGGKSVQLSDQGHHQAVAVAERCQSIDIDTLYVSDFIRAEQTATAISEAIKIPLIKNPIFGEFLEASEFEGLAEDDDRVLAYRKERDFHVAANPDWRHGDGETVSEFMERLHQARHVLESAVGENIAVVSHAFFIQSFVATILLNTNHPSQEWLSIIKTFTHSNTGISMLRYENKRWRVVVFNDHAHFAE